MLELISTFALKPAEALINSLLDQDPHLAGQLRAFSGRNVAIQSTVPPFYCLLSFDGGHIVLSGLEASITGLKEDTRVSGSLPDLLALLRADKESRARVMKKLTMEGDAELLLEIVQVLARLEFDIEDYLAPFVGDIQAHYGMKSVSQIEEFASQANERAKRSVAAYLSEEADLLCTSSESEALYRRLDALRLRLDRLAARCARLEQGLASH